MSPSAVGVQFSTGRKAGDDRDVVRSSRAQRCGSPRHGNTRAAERLMAPRESIAIVGIGCRLPGGVDSAASLWRLLTDEIDAITTVPTDRFDVDELYDERAATPGRIMSRY